jgi:hypothetical protein
MECFSYTICHWLLHDIYYPQGPKQHWRDLRPI